jgi:hypothetical protein
VLTAARLEYGWRWLATKELKPLFNDEYCFGLGKRSEIMWIPWFRLEGTDAK